MKRARLLDVAQNCQLLLLKLQGESDKPAIKFTFHISAEVANIDATVECEYKDDQSRDKVFEDYTEQQGRGFIEALIEENNFPVKIF